MVVSNAETPALMVQARQDTRLPEHFSTTPETPQFVKRSAALDITESQISPAPATPKPFSFPDVLVHVLAPSSMSDDRLNGIANTLKDAGFLIKDPARVRFTIRQSNVRYYSAEDAEAARALAKIVGGTARDFTSFSPSPPTGTIEVWFAGTAPSKVKTAKAAPARAKPVRTKRQPSKAEQDRIRLRNRLVDQLRRGDHL